MLQILIIEFLSQDSRGLLILYVCYTTSMLVTYFKFLISKLLYFVKVTNMKSSLAHAKTPVGPVGSRNVEGNCHFTEQNDFCRKSCNQVGCFSAVAYLSIVTLVYVKLYQHLMLVWKNCW